MAGTSCGSWRTLLQPIHRISLSSPKQVHNTFTITTIRITTRHASTSSAPPSHSSAKEVALARHAAKVNQISLSVASYHARSQKFRIFHGSTNSTRPRHASHKKNVVDVSALNEVLHIEYHEEPDKQTARDEQSQDRDAVLATAYVEPNVPMDRLVEATLPHGLVPKVVMEFPGITVGGGYSGTSGESSSYKHGFFDRNVSRVEMVLADGTVVDAYPEGKGPNSDLFHGAAGALGTMGITTLVEVQLKRARKYVEVTYHPVNSVADAMQKTHEATSDPNNDYVDGILFSPTSGAIITGRLTDGVSSPLPTQTFHKPTDPWFYMHAEACITTSSSPSAPHKELVPLAGYLFRYDRAGFWVGRSAYTYFSFPFTRRTRQFLDDFTHTRMMYTALHASGMARTYMVQDLALPYSAVTEFVRWQNEMDVSAHGGYGDAAGGFGIWPLWLCPLKQSPAPTMHPHHPLKPPSTPSTQTPAEPLMNIGLWGFGPSQYSDFVAANRALERKLEALGGMKWLYAHTYYSEPEFWRSFDKSWYAALREKYGAAGLPSVYEKVAIDVAATQREARDWWWRVLSVWPLGGFWGIWRAIRSGSYKAARAARWKVGL